MTTPSARAKNLPQYGLQTKLAQLQTELDALKTTQYLGGSSVVFFVSSTGEEYDWTGTLTQISGGPTGDGQAFLLVTATAQTMPTLYAFVVAKLYVGSPTSWYRPSDSFTDLLASAVPFVLNVINVPNTALDANVNQFLVQVTGDTTRTAYVQVFIESLDNVDITVTQVA